MNEQVQSQQRAPREWVELITITDSMTPVVVRVQTTASGRPLYSMEIGLIRDGRMLRHMPVYTQPDGAVSEFDSALLAKMIKAAEDAVAADAKKKADEWAARQGARDQRRGGGPGDRGNNDRRRRNGGGERRGRRDREDDGQWR